MRKDQALQKQDFMKPSPNPDEVRAFDFRAPRFRVSFHFFVEVTALRNRCDAVCADIGGDGLAADLAQSLEPGTQVTLWLLFPGESVPARITATVGYRRGKRHGFNFQYSAPAERAAIESFIRSLQT